MKSVCQCGNDIEVELGDVTCKFCGLVNHFSLSQSVSLCIDNMVPFSQLINLLGHKVRLTTIDGSKREVTITETSLVTSDWHAPFINMVFDDGTGFDVNIKEFTSYGVSYMFELVEETNLNLKYRALVRCGCGNLVSFVGTETQTLECPSCERMIKFSSWTDINLPNVLAEKAVLFDDLKNYIGVRVSVVTNNKKYDDVIKQVSYHGSSHRRCEVKFEKGNSHDFYEYEYNKAEGIFIVGNTEPADMSVDRSQVEA